jgi:hypothetical protein
MTGEAIIYLFILFLPPDFDFWLSDLQKMKSGHIWNG